MTPKAAAEALQILCKWRSLLAGWQTGTRPKGDPECDAIRDHRELTLLLRCELTALTALLIEKEIFTPAEFNDALGEEAIQLNRDFEKRFPGATATSSGLSLNLGKIRREGWMEGWKP